MNNTWKISDFGFTQEGTSRYAYASKEGRGTSGYRAPELMRDEACVTQTSDIWALGCILYELAFKKKVFTRDFPYQYLQERKFVPEMHSPPGSERVQSFIKELIRRMLELNWWERPSARHVLVALNSILDEGPTTEVFVMSRTETSGSNSVGAQSLTTLVSDDLNDLGQSEDSEEEIYVALEKVSLEDDDKAWVKARWSCYWYNPCVCC